MIMKEYHYQLVLLGDARRGEFLESVIRQEFSTRSIKQDFFSFIRRECWQSIDCKGEVVGIYFAGEHASLDEEEEQLIQKLIGAGVSILPVLSDLTQCKSLIPDMLNKFNAISERNPDDMVQCIMRRFHVDIQERRVFLSYRRSDSQGIACQLYRALLLKGYHVFLDLYALDGGLVFQDHLQEHLNRSDLVILLDSPHIDESCWVNHELRQTEQHGHGVLQICWPEKTEIRPSLICTRFDLKGSDFVQNGIFEQELVPACIERICDAAERTLIRSLGAKRARVASQLVDRGFLSSDYLEESVNTVLYNGRIVSSSCEGGRIYYLIYPGAPDAKRLYECVKKLKRKPNKPRVKRSYATVCDMVGLLDETRDYLKWFGRKMQAPVIQLNSNQH